MLKACSIPSILRIPDCSLPRADMPQLPKCRQAEVTTEMRPNEARQSTPRSSAYNWAIHLCRVLLCNISPLPPQHELLFAWSDISVDPMDTININKWPAVSSASFVHNKRIILRLMEHLVNFVTTKRAAIQF